MSIWDTWRLPTPEEWGKAEVEMEIHIPPLDKKVKVRELKTGFDIEFVNMSGTPTLTFSMLKELSDYFGTTSIDLDHISERGDCPTCDHGGKLGYSIQIYNPTKNIPLFG